MYVFLIKNEKNLQMKRKKRNYHLEDGLVDLGAAAKNL